MWGLLLVTPATYPSRVVRLFLQLFPVLSVLTHSQFVSQIAPFSSSWGHYFGTFCIFQYRYFIILSLILELLPSHKFGYVCFHVYLVQNNFLCDFTCVISQLPLWFLPLPMLFSFWIFGAFLLLVSNNIIKLRKLNFLLFEHYWSIEIVLWLRYGLSW